MADLGYENVIGIWVRTRVVLTYLTIYKEYYIHPRQKPFVDILFVVLPHLPTFSPFDVIIFEEKTSYLKRQQQTTRLLNNFEVRYQNRSYLDNRNKDCRCNKKSFAFSSFFCLSVGE